MGYHFQPVDLTHRHRDTVNNHITHKQRHSANIEGCTASNRLGYHNSILVALSAFFAFNLPNP
jgi:hypothetical protein